MADLQTALEAHLASLSDDDWRALSARVRPPADAPPGAASTPAAPPQPSGPRWQDAGQGTRPVDMGRPGDAGRAEARKRFGKTRSDGTTGGAQ